MSRKGDSADRAASAKDFKSFRVQIDKLDLQILKLINERADLAAKIGKVKTENNDSVFAPAREEEVIANVLAANRGPLPEVTIRAIYREIITRARAPCRRSTRSPSSVPSIHSVILPRCTALGERPSTWASTISQPCSRK